MSASTFEAELERARALDGSDPLASFRSHFKLPLGANGQPQIYLCGHSLGLAPQAARAELVREMGRWESLAVRAHDHGTPGWIDYAEALQPALAVLAGARVEEVVAMNSLSVNLHLLLASFYRPVGQGAEAAGSQRQRRAILIEAGAFSSDRHAVASQIAWHGGDPERDLIELAPAAGQDLLSTQEIEAVIAREGSRLSLVLWPGVQFRTGQLFDLRRIAGAAHAVGAIAGFDLAHAIGNVPLCLHDDDADFAVWCSYKYLNGGPGAVAGAFVHERHLQRTDLPRLNGWWGHERSTRFDMPAHLDPAYGAARWAVSNPPVFSSAPLRASLPLFSAAGIHALRVKSQQLTGYLEARLLQRCGEHLAVVTPVQPEARGCQLSVRLRQGRERGQQVVAMLARGGVVVDWRAPDIIRLAPVPLYNSFEDVTRCAHILEQALAA